MKPLLAFIACAMALPILAKSPTIPAMIAVPRGIFIAGSSTAETHAVHYPPENAAREQPKRRVTLPRSFRIGRTEITRGQFAEFAAATGWTPDGPCSFLSDGPSARWSADSTHDWQNPGFAQTDTHPVVCVNIADATAYAAWLSKATGRHFRLPSNDEWEYAARAGTTTPVYWGGARRKAACTYANILDASYIRKYQGGVADPAVTFPCDDGHAETAPVASFRPNLWGVYDMIGNVWELTRDCLPAGHGTDCTSHIDRGASWSNTRKYVRAATQHPDLTTARTSVLGFRLVEDLP